MDTERDYTDPRQRFQVLADVGTVRLKRGHEARVAVKTAGYGIAVDIREHVTDEAYTDRDRRVVGGTAKKPRRLREPFVGPTKHGLWLTLEQAEELYQLLGEAVVRAAMMEQGIEEVEA